MATLINPNEPAIVRGIKTVGVGKKGSKSLTPELSDAIKADLDAGIVPIASQGAFFAGILAKGIDPIEQQLIPDPKACVDTLTKDAPDFIQWVCHQLVVGKTLDKSTAYDLGKFLFSDSPGDGARGLIASFLRVRYETDDEYEGIYQAMQETIEPGFSDETPPGEPIVQIAEPFDGNDHSFLVTPLVGQAVQCMGYRVIHAVGRNSGPKLVMNLYDVMAHLSCTWANCNQDLGQPKPNFGWFYDQADVSRALDRWVNVRQQTIKRPFLSTLEKFINPAKADLMVCSAFHPPYGEKMITIGERAGFRGVMVIRNGIEGSLAMPLKRPAKILLSSRQFNGTYVRDELQFDVEAFLSTPISIEEKRESLTAKTNAALIAAHQTNGQSGDEWFDARVNATVEAFRLGLSLLKEKAYGLG